MSEAASKTVMVIAVGGKQHLADAGSKLVISGVTAKAGETIMATDLLTNKEVSLKVLKDFLGEKIHGLKFKNKVRYTRRYGHRQQMALVEVAGSVAKVTKVQAVVKTKPAAKTAPKKAKVGSK